MFVGFIPSGFVLWLIGFYLDAVADDVSHLPDVGNDSCGFCLQHDVADGCAFHRTCHYRDSDGVGGELHQKFVVCASAYDMEFLYLKRCHFFQVVQHLAIAQGETFEYAACHFLVVLWHVLTCSFAIFLDGFRIGRFVYLLARKVIRPYITVSIWVTVAVFSGIFWAINPAEYTDPLFNLLTGGILLGSVFMATDYVTSPMSNVGGIIFGVGIGIITMLIRYFGAYPEGMSFAILIMNSVVPLINKWCHAKKYGRA